MTIHEHFLASYYRRLFDAELERGHLNRLTVLLAFPGLTLMALGTGFDLEWLRCLAALPLIIAIVTGANSLIRSILIRRLRRELDSVPRSAGVPPAGSARVSRGDELVIHEHARHWRLCLLLALALSARADNMPTYNGSLSVTNFPFIDYTNAAWTWSPNTNATWYLDNDYAHPIELSISTNLQTITITNRVLTIIHAGRTNQLTFPLNPQPSTLNR